MQHQSFPRRCHDSVHLLKNQARLSFGQTANPVVWR